MLDSRDNGGDFMENMLELTFGLSNKSKAKSYSNL